MGDEVLFFSFSGDLFGHFYIFGLSKRPFGGVILYVFLHFFHRLLFSKVKKYYRTLRHGGFPKKSG